MENLLEIYWKYGDFWDLASSNQTWLENEQFIDEIP